MTEEEQIDYFIKDLETVLVNDTLPEYTAAIVIEPVLGNGGFTAAPTGWVKKVRALCDKYGIMNLNRNKQSLTLNLKSEKGKEIFRGLVKQSDIVVENYRPGVMSFQIRHCTEKRSRYLPRSWRSMESRRHSLISLIWKQLKKV